MSDTTIPKTVRVSRDQVSAARALIRLPGRTQPGAHRSLFVPLL